jgi:hypothetical protein
VTGPVNTDAGEQPGARPDARGPPPPWPAPPGTGTQQPTDPEDLKIIALARAALARSNTGEAACVRDSDGRTYAGVRVELPHLKLSAISVAVAMAVSSGAAELEAVAVAGDDAPSPGDFAVVTDLGGPAVVVWSVDRAGSVRARA